MNIQKSYSDLVFRRTSIEILQCFLIFADAQLTKIPTPTRCKEFCRMAMRRIIMQTRKTAGAIDGSLQCIRRRLLAISASKQVE